MELGTEKVVTRFAPSPTGLMHIGNARTALYSYLWACKNGGKFILRIEDTDRQRLVEGAAEEIIQTLQKLGLRWDEGPVYQSDRLEIYKEYAQQLVEKEFAYEKEGAVWFRVPKDGTTSWTDLVGSKEVVIQNSLHDDFVMLKSDGYPTYNFAVVVDDHLMGVTHTIRGVEFISSAPKHIMIYKAFGWELPKFAHLPLFLGSDKSKLSKRHGAKPASEFLKDGYLPEALLNFIALLSWTPPDGKEIISLEEMEQTFDISKAHLTNPVFDMEKLDWMNGEYIRRMSDEELTKMLQEYLVDHPAKDKIAPLVPLVKERIKKLSDFVPLTNFIFEKPEYEAEVFQKVKLDSLNVQEVLRKIVERLEKMERPWSSEKFEETFRELAKELNLPAGSIFQLIRIAVSGQLVTPPLLESIEILGETQALARVKFVLSSYPNF